jgi:uncharacterized membrane protein YphA (DoxX/SURF4 family)
MKYLNSISRIILGLVFTFSGFVKAIDPLGSAYKFTDYFTEAFGLPALSAISLPLAILLISMEFLVGVCLLFNAKQRLASLGALIFMVIFTPLTLYIAITNPVQDCGCFGDAIVISNWSTFYKDLILLVLAIIAFMASKGIYNTYKGYTDWIIALATLIFIVAFQVYSLNYSPIIDFRPYKVGTYIPDKMKIPEGEKQDSFAIFYTMKNLKSGETVKIDDNSYLKKEIWKDTLWQITETSEPVLVKKGYKPPIYNFKAYEFSDQTSANDVDAMQNMLAEKGFSFLVISYDLEKANLAGFKKMRDLLNYAYAQEINTHILTSSTSKIEEYRSKIPFIARYYNADPITLKTIIRSNPGLLLLKEGKIIGKWHDTEIPTIKEYNKLINKNSK